MWVSIAKPTIRRLKTSNTVAKYSFPLRVGISVMSATHSKSGASAWKARFTKSGAGRSRLFRTVVGL